MDFGFKSSVEMILSTADFIVANLKFIADCLTFLFMNKGRFRT